MPLFCFTRNDFECYLVFLAGVMDYEQVYIMVFGELAYQVRDYEQVSIFVFVNSHGSFEMKSPQNG